MIQDDATQMLDQILQMDIIYSQASLTIVAMSGTNATSHLSGVFADTRQPITQAVQITDTNVMLSYPPSSREALLRSLAHPAIIPSTAYETRASTFQERMLSRRCLYLSDYQSLFVCRSARYQERSPAENEFLQQIKDFLYERRCHIIRAGGRRRP